MGYLRSIDKMNLNKFVRTAENGTIHYLDLIDSISTNPKRYKIPYSEFVLHFYTVAINEFKKNDKISINYLSKVISIISTMVEWSFSDSEEALEKGEDASLYLIGDDLLNKVRCIKKYYMEYIERTKDAVDEDFVGSYLDPIVNLINTKLPIEENGALFDYVDKIKTLEEKVISLTKGCKHLEKEKASLEEAKASLESKCSEKTDTITKIKNQKDKYEQDIRALEEEIKEARLEIASLEKSLEEKNGEIEGLEKISKLYDELLEKCEKLEKHEKEIKEAKFLEDKEKTRNDLITDFVMSELYSGELSLGLLTRKVKRELGYDLERGELRRIFNDLKGVLNIKCSGMGNSPKFVVVPPKIYENETFDIDILDKEYLDILLVSDIHVRDFDYETENYLNALYEFASKNGIGMIMDLGDLFHFPPSRECSYDNYGSKVELVTKAISLIPHDNSITHLILGGNHEKHINDLGFDPIDLLSSNRDDILGLGYTFGRVSFTNSYGCLGNMGLHHPDSYDEIELEYSPSLEHVKTAIKYLDKRYKEANLDRNDSFIDLFGHFHRFRFNGTNNYGYLPARAPIHLRVYFDSKSKIGYMVFKPVDLRNGNYLMGEIVHSKSNELVKHA